MPAKTPKQYRAMRAAAAGKSKLGIPKSVGQEFVRSTPQKVHHHKTAAKGFRRRAREGYE